MMEVSLNELCTYDRGLSIPRRDTNIHYNIPYLHYGDIYKKYNFRIDLDKELKDIIKINNDTDLKPGYLLSNGNIVYTLTSETVEDLGHSALIINKNNIPFVAGMETTIIRIKNTSLVLPAYLNYIFQSDSFKQKLRQYVTGMKVYRVHPKDLLRIKVNLPTMEAQSKIIRILDSISDKIDINNKVNDYLADTAKSILRHLLNEKSSNEKVTLSDIANITMGQSPPGDTYNKTGKGVVFYQGRAEFGNYFPKSRLYTTQPKKMAFSGDILMSIRAPVGDINLALIDCCIGRGLVAIRSKNEKQSFIHYLLELNRERLEIFNMEGTVFGCIKKDQLNDMEFVVPVN